MHSKVYRVLMNGLARGMAKMMRWQGVSGHLCIGPDISYFDWNGIKLEYHFSEFGAGGDIDSGGNIELATRAKLSEFIKPGCVFFDIGAHEGLYSLTIKRDHPSVCVHAFDPLPKHIIRNIQMNNLDIKVHPVVVGDHVGTTRITTDKRSSNHVSETGCDVEMTTIDEVVASGRAPPPDVIKIDVEGFEPHVIRGGAAVLARHHPLIVTEINHCFDRYGNDMAAWTRSMSDLGYTLHTLRDGALSPPVGMIKSLQQLPYSDEFNYWWLTQ